VTAQALWQQAFQVTLGVGSNDSPQPVAGTAAATPETPELRPVSPSPGAAAASAAAAAGFDASVWEPKWELDSEQNSSPAAAARQTAASGADAAAASPVAREPAAMAAPRTPPAAPPQTDSRAASLADAGAAAACGAPDAGTMMRANPPLCFGDLPAGFGLSTESAVEATPQLAAAVPVSDPEMQPAAHSDDEFGDLLDMLMI